MGDNHNNLLADCRSVVQDFWEHEGSFPFHTWKHPRRWHIRLKLEIMEQIWQDLKSRKIRIKHGPDIMQWGNLPKGSFIIKEEYSIASTKEEDHQFPL